MTNATAKSASHLSHADPRGHFTMLLAISVPVMALYAARAIDFENMRLKNQPTEVSVELAAPARMGEAVTAGSTLLDTPALGFAASYSGPGAPARMPSGEATLASATAGATVFATLASY